MKKAIILLSTLFMMTACGGSGDKAKSTNPAGTVGSGVPISGVAGGSGIGSTGNPILPGSTPYSVSVNNTLRANLSLEFNEGRSGGVVAEGQLDMSNKVGFGACTLPVGSYDVSTITPGKQLSVVHNYDGIIARFDGPVSFTALIENTLSMQNVTTGEWEMTATLKVQSVGGATCAFSVYFQFPSGQ